LSEAISDTIVEKQPAPPAKGFDYNLILKSPAFVPGLVLLFAFSAAFWHLFADLPKIWFEGDGYYSHGALVPVISGYVIYKWWPHLKDTPIKPSMWALLPMILTGWVLFAGTRIQQIQILSVSLVMLVACAVWFILGWRWLLAIAGPILFLLSGLPIWSAIIDTYTNPLQLISTDVSYALLQALNFNPLKVDSTTIYLDRFTLDVGVACSGLKLLIAVTAFTLFFMMIGGLKWWGNAIMVLAVLPLCLFINGLRIALIGVVGDTYGADAGHQFHDYSGYLTLIVCFFILFSLMRSLGWKD
jgi:exosortase